MKLNRTREEWALNALYYRTPAPLDCYKEALEDLATLFAEVDRLTAQLAERDRELHEERMRHLVTMTESYGGYDKEFPPMTPKEPDNG